MSLPASPLLALVGLTDAAGAPLAGGLLTGKITGTGTTKAIYQDALRVATWTQPIALDSAGRAAMFIDPGGMDLVVKNSSGVTLWTATNYEDVGATFLNALGYMQSAGGKNVGSSGSYSVLATDRLVTINSGVTSPVIVTLPASASWTQSPGSTYGQILVIKNAAGGTVSVVPSGSDQIDGLGISTAYTIAAASGQSKPAAMFISDAVSNWYVIAKV